MDERSIEENDDESLLSVYNDDLAAASRFKPKQPLDSNIENEEDEYTLLHSNEALQKQINCFINFNKLQ
jgi:hypothetical protein